LEQTLMVAPRLPWIKFWPEAIEHEKFAALTDAECWSWVVIWSKASLQPKRWRYASIQHAHHVTGRPVKHIRRLIEVRLLDDSQDGLSIHDARMWQDSANLASTQRERWCNGGATLTEPPPNGGARMEKNRRNGDLEGEGEGEGDKEKDVEGTPPATQAPPKGGARRRRVTEVDDGFRDELEERYWEALGSREAARDVMSDALNHAAATKHGDQRAYLRNWVRSEAEKATARRRQPMSKMATARAARPADDGPFEARAVCAKCGARESGKDSDLCVLCQMREAQIAKGMVVEVSPGVYSAA
jgi:hypothetical protein